MQRSGHVGIGLVLFAPVALGLTWAGATTVLPVGLLGVLVASTAPDLDEFVPHIAHRGITHTLFAAVVTGVVFGLVAPSIVEPGTASSAAWLGHPRSLSLAAGLLGFLGVVGHLAGDVLTPMGIRPWYPVTGRHYSLEFVRSRNRLANATFLAVGAVGVVVATVGGLTLRAGFGSL